MADGMGGMQARQLEAEARVSHTTTDARAPEGVARANEPRPRAERQRGGAAIISESPELCRQAAPAGSDARATRHCRHCRKNADRPQQRADHLPIPNVWRPRVS